MGMIGESGVSVLDSLPMCMLFFVTQALALVVSAVLMYKFKLPMKAVYVVIGAGILLVAFQLFAYNTDVGAVSFIYSPIALALVIAPALGFVCLLSVLSTRMSGYGSKKLAFHALAIAIAVAVIYYAVSFVPAEYTVLAIVVLSACSGICLAFSFGDFPEEYPPVPRMSHVYTQQKSYYKLIVFSFVFAVALGVIFSYMGMSVEYDVIPYAIIVGFIIAAVRVFAQLFIVGRKGPTNSLAFLVLIYAAFAGLVVPLGVPALKLICIAVLAACFFLHSEQCIRKSLKCAEIFKGKCLFLLVVVETSTFLGVGMGVLLGYAIFSNSAHDNMMSMIAYWIIGFAILFVTLVFNVDRETKVRDSKGISDYIDENMQMQSEDIGPIDTVICAVAQEHDLSPRQTEILAMMSRGYNVSTMEQKLFISKNTVRSHIYTVYHKMGVHSQQDLISYIEKYKKDLDRF
jgi:DNA-binding CsgD family transcriptional regulator